MLVYASCGAMPTAGANYHDVHHGGHAHCTAPCGAIASLWPYACSSLGVRLPSKRGVRGTTLAAQ